MANGYTVTSINQTQELDAANRLVSVVTAQFELDNGAGNGEATVPLTDGWDAALEAEIRAKAEAMMRLLGL